MLGIAVIAMGIGGSLPGMIDVLTHQDEVYLQSASGGGGAGVAPTGGTASLLLLMTITRVAAVLIVGSFVTWRLARRHHSFASVAAWWLTWDLAAVVVSALGLAHYAQQLEPAACVCVTLLAARLVRGFPFRLAAMALVAGVAGWAVTVAALLGPSAEASLVVPQDLSGFVTSITSPHVITHYLGGGWEHSSAFRRPRDTTPDSARSRRWCARPSRSSTGTAVRATASSYGGECRGRTR